MAILRPSPEETRRRLSPALVASMAVHAVVLTAILTIAMSTQDDIRDESPARADPPERMVWVAIAGPGGGGGGRAADVPAPPAPAPPPPADAPAPVAVPVTLPTPIDDVPQPLGAEPVPFDLASAASTGVIGPPSAPRGDGRGEGSGDGSGDGAGDGGPKGIGDGAFDVGNGVTSPEPLTRASGRYTSAAVLARAQGIISVECIVEPDGQCSDVRVVRGFNPAFGLDAEALSAARRWRFRPGRRNNVAVPVRIRLDIEFRIH